MNKIKHYILAILLALISSAYVFGQGCAPYPILDLQGYVTLSTGQPPPKKVLVTVYRNGEFLTTAATRSTGHYSAFMCADSGLYFVVAYDPVYGYSNTLAITGTADEYGANLQFSYP